MVGEKLGEEIIHVARVPWEVAQDVGHAAGRAVELVRGTDPVSREAEVMRKATVVELKKLALPTVPVQINGEL